MIETYKLRGLTIISYNKKQVTKHRTYQYVRVAGFDEETGKERFFSIRGKLVEEC